jgi:DNA-binding transcriptional ArsR family regulator
MRRLPLALKRAIADFSFVYAGLYPDFVYPPATGGYASFDEELERVRGMDPVLAAFEFTRPLFDHEGVRDPRKLESQSVRRHVLEGAEQAGGSPELARLAFDDPAELARRFTALLEWYWDAAFEAEWKRLEPRLAASVEEAGRAIAGSGLYPFLGGLSTRLRVDSRKEEFGLDLPHHHRVPVTEDAPLSLVPSAYVWPHVAVNCDEPWPLALVYPAPFMVRQARQELPPEELLRLLRAVGDATRLRALKLIAEQPRTTQELAPLVGISEAGLSKHLRTLADAGVVETRRDDYVLYSLVAERLEPLSSALLSFLGPRA